MYSKEALSGIFQRILQFEEEAKALYEDCIKKLEVKRHQYFYKQITGNSFF